MSDEPFLSRWSRRKTEAKSVEQPVEQARAPTALPGVVPEAAPPEPLPPIESLTPESDFAPFMKADVDPGLKRQAFKKLIEDPQFNVMDGLDVYIDDYSKPDPLPDGWLEKMNQVKYLGIFKAPEEEVPPPPQASAAPLQSPTDAPALVAPGEAPPADTSAKEIPPPGVGKTAVSREGV